MLNVRIRLEKYIKNVFKIRSTINLNLNLRFSANLT